MDSECCSIINAAYEAKSSQFVTTWISFKSVSGSNDKIDFYIRRQRRLGSSWHLTSYSLITSSVLWPLVSKAHRSRHYLSNRSFFGSGRHLRYLLFCLIYYFQETAEIKCTCWKLNRNIIIKDRFVQLKDCLSFFLSLFF